ncbi:MAG TPA: FAD-dependent oxidoreductase [Solirubrobacteraceae bacterium]|nr:FAD-dependent oxidoreductase [Solirubrobacteraceae bacterium]
MGRSPDVVVVGAGVVGASCAYYLAAAGVRVRLYDRSFIASGSSGSCEGNVLAWDKELERELPLAQRSADLWEGLSQQLDDFEYDRKGSVVVAETEDELRACAERNRVLAGLGVEGIVLDAAGLRAEEPYAAHDLPGGVLYPGDAQVEPRLATAALVRGALAHGAELRTDVDVTAILRGADGRATGIETSAGRVGADLVVIAAGVWTPKLLETAGLSVPVTPRKGQIVVLERSPVVFRRKLSEAGYVAAVEADDAALQIAMVVESTPSGTALLGSSRQHVGFDRTVELGVAGAIARRAARFFPILNDARALRVYAGLRPLTPDHVPIIGPFADAPNICVATGHEGAGIGLAPATGELVAAWHTGAPTPVPIEWFSPDRFAPVELAAT